ncbi:hypothetical protein RhiirA4_443369 [Rhizophagus irregularis]|uniref:Uncharacterized protein n=1 Tax=Rhizophagus irregularis TaxID=588596 RepID=A0A2I1GE00_9GLOM|nr:hypothetical protein RhiirA4_443369 [Rhizophagus irregularis]
MSHDQQLPNESFFTPEGARHITGGKVFGGQYTPEEFPLQTKGAEIGQGYYQSARPTKGNNSVDSAPVDAGVLFITSLVKLYSFNENFIYFDFMDRDGEEESLKQAWLKAGNSAKSTIIRFITKCGLTNQASL